MEQKKSLPLYGVGPLYVYGILAIDVIGITLTQLGFIPRIEQNNFRIPCIILGTLLIVINIYEWVKSAIISKLDEHIKRNELVVTGMYAYMRNPIYSAITFALFGFLLIYGNVLLLPLLFVDWIALTLLMKNTEEKWLLNLYGQQYIDYCKRVNRFFPWFKRRYTLS